MAAYRVELGPVAQPEPVVGPPARRPGPDHEAPSRSLQQAGAVLECEPVEAEYGAVERRKLVRPVAVEPQVIERRRPDR